MSAQPKPSRIPPPPRPVASEEKPTLSRLTSPPPVATPANLSVPSEGSANLNFKVDADFHHRFKTEAVARRVTSKELLEMAFEHYLASFPR